jgi:signal transduction histidine kinase
MSTTATPPPVRRRVLYVDDEKLSLKYFQEIVSEEFDVLTAPSAEEGWAALERDPDGVAIVISDQRLGGMQGTDFLARLREKHPAITRILATAYSDIATAVSAINDGAIYQYISKPWDPNSLLPTLRTAMEAFILRAERQQLLSEKAAMVRDLIVGDRLAGYGVLAEGINHHLRNALVPVEVYLQLAGETGPDSPTDGVDAGFLDELRQAAKSQVRRIIDILGKLSSIHKVNTPRKDDILAPEELWREVIAQLAIQIDRKNASLELRVPQPLPPVACNRNRLIQVLRLVLEDEIERIEPDGAITIVLEHRSGGDDVAEHIRMEISDTGADVDPARLASVFTPFFLRPENPQHVSINLATSYVTLCSLGGWAAATNEPERGTVITLCLPLQPPARSSEKLPLEAWERVFGSPHEQPRSALHPREHKNGALNKMIFT